MTNWILKNRKDTGIEIRKKEKKFSRTSVQAKR